MKKVKEKRKRKNTSFIKKQDPFWTRENHLGLPRRRSAVQIPPGQWIFEHAVFSGSSFLANSSDFEEHLGSEHRSNLGGMETLIPISEKAMDCREYNGKEVKRGDLKDERKERGWRTYSNIYIL